jgi:hypothetical protein
MFSFTKILVFWIFFFFFANLFQYSNVKTGKVLGFSLKWVTTVFTLSLGLISPPPISPQSKESWLNLGLTCWNSAVNAQGSRVIVGRSIENMCSSSEGAQEKRKEGVKTRWNSIYRQNRAFLSFVPTPPWMRMYFLAGFFWLNLTRFWTKLKVLDQTQGSGAVFSWVYRRLSYGTENLNSWY